MEPKTLLDALDGTEFGAAELTFDISKTMATVVMEFIAFCSYMEVERLRVVNELVACHDDLKVVAPLLAAIINPAARRAAIQKAAEVRLHDAGTLLAKFKSVMKFADRVGVWRNRYAHDVWLFTQALPGSVVLISPEVYVVSHADAVTRSTETEPSVPIVPADQAWVHTPAYITYQLQQARRATDLLKALECVLSAGPQAARGREILEPEIHCPPKDRPRRNQQ